MSATVKSERIAVYPNVELPPWKLLVFGEIIELSPGAANIIEVLPTLTTGILVVCFGNVTNLYFNVF